MPSPSPPPASSSPSSLEFGVVFLCHTTLSFPSNDVGFYPFLVFIGITLSITAFPVLARILAEFKLLTTTVSEIAMAAAAFNNVAAWVLLALPVALFGGSRGTTPLVSLWIILFFISIRRCLQSSRKRMGATLERSPKTERQSLFFRDLASPSPATAAVPPADTSPPSAKPPPSLPSGGRTSALWTPCFHPGRPRLLLARVPPRRAPCPPGAHDRSANPTSRTRPSVLPFPFQELGRGEQFGRRRWGVARLSAAEPWKLKLVLSSQGRRRRRGARQQAEGLAG